MALVVAGVTGALVAVAVFVLVTRPAGEDDRLLDVVVQVMHDKSEHSVTDVEAECMAEALIRAAGRDRLLDLGVMDGVDPVLALDNAEKHLAVPRAFDCLDDQAVIDLMVATWPEDNVAGLGRELAPCVYRRWWDELGRDTVVHVYATLIGNQPPPLDETLEPDDFALAAAAISDCQLAAEAP